MNDELILRCKFAEAADAAVHQVAHALVIDAHDFADVLILAVFQIVEVDDLTLTWGQFVEAFLDVAGERVELLQMLLVVLLSLGYRAHGEVGNLIVADVDVAAELIVDAVAQGDIEITLNILNVVQMIALGEEFDKHIMDAIFDQLTVGRELHAESEKLVNILVI